MPVPFYSPITVPVTPTSEYCLTNKAYVDTAITAAINALHLSDAATKTTTTSVTNGSGALITSGGVYSYIQGLSLANTYAAKIHTHDIMSLNNRVDLFNQLLQNLTNFDIYNDNDSYAIGDCVIHDGYIWRAVTGSDFLDPQNPSEDDGTYWEHATVEITPRGGGGGDSGSLTPAQMSLEADNVIQGQDAVVRVTIPSDSGNVTVSCEFDGDTYTGVLDSDDGEDAVYAVTIPAPSPGTWDADVTVTGSDKYTFEPGSTAFTVFPLSNWD